MPAKVCQMYSYKGGAGRTVATANIAGILAKEFGKKVVCIDMDLEGAGLGVVFGVHRQVGGMKCVQDIFGQNAPLQGLEDFKRHWWSQMNIDIGKSMGSSDLAGKLFLVPARFGGHDAIEFSEGIDYAFGKYLGHVKSLVNPDVILIDSSSGFQDWSVLGMTHSEVLLLFFRWNSQSVEGTIESVKFFCNPESDLPSKKIVLVPSAVPRASLERKKFRLIFEESNARLKNETKPEHAPAGDESVVRFEQGIGEAVGLKWSEKILAFEDELDDDEAQTLRDYRELAKLMLSL